MTEFSWEQHTKECTEEHLPSTCGKPCTCKLEDNEAKQWGNNK